MNRGWTLGAGLIALVMMGGCVDREAQAQAQRTKEIIEDPNVPVVVQAPVLRDLDDTLEATGTIQTSDVIDVGPINPGRLVRVYVRDGDAVNVGQVIAEQETEDLLARVRQAQAGVTAASAQLSQATTAAQVEPSRSAANVRAAEAQVASAQAALEKLENGARAEELAQAEAALAAAISARTNAQSNFDRQSFLVEEGAIAGARLETAQLQLDQAEASVTQAEEALAILRDLARPEDLAAARQQVRLAEEQVDIAKAAQRLDPTLQQQVAAAEANLESARETLRIANKALRDARIVAPVSGRISGRPLQAGAILAPGVPIARIVGVEGVYFEAEVPQTRLDAVEVGAPVRVTVDGLPNAQLSGTVTAINPVASDVARLFKVRVTLNEQLEGVRPGMFARGELVLESRVGVATVPNLAVMSDSEGSFVMTVVDGVAQRVAVDPGLEFAGFVEVSGLSPDAQVVIKGQENLAVGASVRLVTDAEFDLGTSESEPEAPEGE